MLVTRRGFLASCIAVAASTAIGKVAVAKLLPLSMQPVVAAVAEHPRDLVLARMAAPTGAVLSKGAAYEGYGNEAIKLERKVAALEDGGIVDTEAPYKLMCRFVAQAQSLEIKPGYVERHEANKEERNLDRNMWALQNCGWASEDSEADKLETFALNKNSAAHREALRNWARPDTKYRFQETAAGEVELVVEYA